MFLSFNKLIYQQTREILIYYRVRYKMLKFWNQSRKAVILLTVLQYFDNKPFCINIRYATF